MFCEEEVEEEGNWNTEWSACCEEEEAGVGERESFSWKWAAGSCWVEDRRRGQRTVNSRSWTVRLDYIGILELILDIGIPVLEIL